MKLNKVLLSMLAAVAVQAIAAEPAPVVDISTQKSYSGSSVLSASEQLEQTKRQLEAQKRAQLNLQNQLTELQDEVNELRGVTELHTHQLTQILDRQRELYQEIERRVSQATQQTAPPSTIAANTVGQTPSVNYSSDLTENEAYDRAVNMVLKDKQYDLAIPAFKEFLSKYPNSGYAANAHYWLGQLLFNKGENAQAAKEFEMVVTRFKESTKRSDAMLKLGMVAQKQNNLAKAKQLYQQVMSEYPDSSAAKLAGPRLSSLN